MSKKQSLQYFYVIQFTLLVLLPLAFFPPWISLPLSGAVSGLGYVGGAMQAESSLIPFVGLFLVAIPALAFSIHFRKKWPAVLLAAVCVGFVLLIPAFLASVDTRTLPFYVQDVEDFRSLREFFLDNFIPNKGGGMALPVSNPMDSLAGRMRVIVDVLGWGWFLALGLALAQLAMSMLRAGLASIVPALLVAMAPGVLFVSPVLQAAQLRADAQSAFVAGRYPVAMNHITTAFRLDPLLSYGLESTTFYSQLNAVAFGENKPSAVLYLMETRVAKGQRLKVIQTLQDALRERSADENFDPVAYQVKRRLLYYSSEMAKRFFRDKQWNEALILLRRTQFLYPENAVTEALLTLPYMRQNAFEQCVDSADGAMLRIIRSSLRADLLSTRGECQLMMGANDAARDSFTQSLEIDNERNLRAVRGLSGT